MSANPDPELNEGLSEEPETLSRPRLNAKNGSDCAQKFQDFNGDEFKHLRHYRGDFYRWLGTHYAEADEALMRSTIYNFLDDGLDEKGQAFVANRNNLAEAMLALEAKTHVPSTTPLPCWIDNDDEAQSTLSLLWEPCDIVSCKNGLLHLPTRKLAPHTPQFFALNRLDLAFDPQAPAPSEWLKFLASLWPDDQQAIATLQEMFGYLLSGDLRQQKIFLLVGPMRGGKGTIAHVLEALLGSWNLAGPTLASLGETFGLQSLIGKSVAVIADARLDARAGLSVITERLLSISGADDLTINRKYRDAWTGKLGVRFLILTNELPHFKDASGALASRFILLRLKQSFYGREDLGLLGRLLPELPGIMNWALEGWRRLDARGRFIVPQSSADAIQQLEDLASPIGAFLREECIIGPGHAVDKDDLCKRWAQWCNSNGMRPTTKAVFGRDLISVEPTIQSRRLGAGKNRSWIYDGIELNEQVDAPVG